MDSKKIIKELQAKLRYKDEIIQTYRKNWLKIQKELMNQEAKVTEEVTHGLKETAAARLKLERDAHQVRVKLYH